MRTIIRNVPQSDVEGLCRSLGGTNLSEVIKNALIDEQWIILKALIASGRPFENEYDKSFDFKKLRNSGAIHHLMWTTHWVAECLEDKKTFEEIPKKFEVIEAKKILVNRVPELDPMLGDICYEMLQKQIEVFKNHEQEDGHPSLKKTMENAGIRFASIFCQKRFLDLVEFDILTNDMAYQREMAKKILSGGGIDMFRDLPDGSLHNVICMSEMLDPEYCSAILNIHQIAEIARLSLPAAPPSGPIYEAGNEDAFGDFCFMHQKLSAESIYHQINDLAAQYPRLFLIHSEDIESNSEDLIKLLKKCTKAGTLQLFDNSAQQYVADNVEFQSGKKDMVSISRNSILTDGFLKFTNSLFDSGEILNSEATVTNVLKKIDQQQLLLTCRIWASEGVLEGCSETLAAIAVRKGWNQVLAHLGDLGLSSFELEKQAINHKSAKTYGPALAVIQSKEAKLCAQQVMREFKPNL